MWCSEKHLLQQIGILKGGGEPPVPWGRDGLVGLPVPVAGKDGAELEMYGIAELGSTGAAELVDMEEEEEGLLPVSTGGTAVPVLPRQ